MGQRGNLKCFFVAVVVDENITPPSGCSIDASVKFLKELGAELDVDFFTRMKLTVQEGDDLKQIDFNDLDKQENPGDLMLFDALVGDLSTLRNQWPVQLKNSNLKQLV